MVSLISLSNGFKNQKLLVLSFVSAKTKFLIFMENFIRILLLFVCVQSFGQGVIVDNIASGSNGSMNFSNLPSAKYSVLRGSPYISEEFKDGSVMMANAIGRWQKGYQLRLDTYLQQLEFKDTEVIKVASSKQVRAFKIGYATYMSGFTAVDKQNSATYYEILYDGKTKLLKYTSTILEVVKNADDVKQGDQFTTYSIYYLVENDTLIKFFPTKKNFLKHFSSEKAKKIDQFISEKNLKMKDDNDFAEVLKFYDSNK